MHSMDDVQDAMQAFRQVLEKFQASLEMSMADVETHHGIVDPLWPSDQARRFYDLHHEPLQEMLMLYIQRQGPSYLDFLDEKLRALEGYLNG